MKHFMVGQKASDEAKIDSDFYAILLRYELHESMENQITSHRFLRGCSLNTVTFLIYAKI